MKKTLLFILGTLSIVGLNAQKNTNLQRLNKGGGGGDTESVYTLETCEIDYTNGTSFGDYINGVQIGTTGNLNSGATANETGYEFNESSIFRITRGQESLISVQNGPLASNRVKAWIDYNHDGEFDESEAIGNAQFFNDSYTWIPFTFTTPQYIKATTAILRISLYFSESDSLACGTKSFGETEDYVIVINDSASPYCTPIPEELYGLPNHMASGGDFISAIESGIVEQGFNGYAPEYTYLSDLTMYGKQGNTTAISFTFGEYPNDFIHIYIDFNNNGNFEPEELVINQSNANPFESFDEDIMVPNDALTGMTRMRVICTDNDGDLPCDDISYGHVMDYNFLIHPALGVFDNCYSEYSSGPQYGDFIRAYSFADIAYTNNTNTNVPYYIGFNSPSYLVKGENYDLSITTGDWGSDYYSLWIDYSGNQELENNERVFQSISGAENTNLTSTITIPESAQDGATILRFQCVYNEFDAALCESHDYGETHDYTVIFTGVPSDYCAAVFTSGNTDGDYINAVSLGDINLTDIGETMQAYYHDYTTMSTDLETEGAYTLTIQAGDYDEDTYTAWIDFNQDGTYSVDEKIAEEVGENSFQNFNFDFTVPNSALTGNTRMRIMCSDEDEILEPCISGDFGEYMEFSINITNPNLLTQTITFSALDDVLENVGSFSLNASASSGLDITYAVVSGPATVAGNTVTITGAGPVEIEATQTGNDEYNAAPSVSQNFCSNPLQPTITGETTADAVVLTSSSPMNNQWMYDEATIEGANNQTYDATELGLYSVLVNVGGCVSETSEAFDVIAISVEEQETFLLECFPNPVIDELTIVSPTNDSFSYRLINMTGKLVLQGRVEDAVGKLTISTEGISQGSYSLILQSQDKVFKTSIVKM